MHICRKIIYILWRRKMITKRYCCELPKEILIYNIKYHLKTCSTNEECIDKVIDILENFEVKDNNDRKDE